MIPLRKETMLQDKSLCWSHKRKLGLMKENIQGIMLDSKKILHNFNPFYYS